MAIALRKDTASQEVMLGPFLDSTDGNTEEAGLTIANTDLKIWKAGATTLADKNSGGATVLAGTGYYYTTLDDTDTSVAGPLVIFCHMTGALPIRVECVVYPTQVFDSLFSTDKLQVHVDEMTAGIITATTIADNAIDFATFAADCKTGAGLKANVESISANAITATAINADAITSAKIADGAIDAATFAAGAIDAAALAADAGTEIGTAVWATATRTLTALDEDSTTIDLDATIAAAVPSAATIADAVWDEASTGHTDAGKAGAQLWTDVDGIVTTLGVAGAGLSAVPWNAAWDAEVQSECTDALNAYDPPTNAEMEARTLVAADYVVTSDTIAGVTSVTGIAAGGIAAASFAAGAINAAAIATGAIDADSIASNAITDAKIATGAITSAKFAAGAIDAAAIASNAIDADALATDAVTEIIAAIKAISLADAESFTASTLPDIVRKVYWYLTQKMEITEASGDYTLYKTNGTDSAATGNIASAAGTTTRTAPTWA